MRIPSYDDLTPSIPDITPRETFSQVNRFLPRGPAPASHQAADAIVASAPLYACLRASQPVYFDLKTPSPHFVIARDFSPRVERHGGSSVVLDVGGLGRLLGDPQAIGVELDRAAAGSAARLRIAIARTQTAARLLAIGCSGLSVAPGDVAATIAPLPIEALRAFMDDDDQEIRGGKAATRMKATAARLDTLRRWGLTTLGDIAALPAADLSERMGQVGLALQQLARGIDRAPLVPDPGVRRFVQSMELEWPIDSLEPLSFVLARLLDPLSSALERADRGAAALRLDLRLVDRTIHGRVLPLPAAIRDAKVLRTLLLLDLESHPPSTAVDIVTIEIDPAPARIVQYSLLERAMPSPETLATLAARLGALVGEARCGSPSLLDTWRPDGFEMKRFSPDSREPQTANRDPSTSSGSSRATSRDEPRIANREYLIVRRFRPPVAVRVTVERGRPVRLAIDRRGMPGGHVEQAAGPWRTSGAWWDAEGAGWDRDEWDVALSDGSLCRLFRDRITERWFLEGVLD
jgi:protein ImuB